MAGKGKDGSDQSVRERRLRPVYEFLDVGNNKRVIQEVDRLLKKQPDFQCAKALKALAQLRMGNATECKTIVDLVVNEIPTDDSTIQALTICYRELGLPKMVCTILENASKVEKTEDNLSACFMANVRVCDFQKQYQVALVLYKLNPKPPYFAWAVMSLYVKAQIDKDPSSLRISLPLAERMMRKYLEENNVNSEHESCLYMLILYKLGNYKKILELLDEFSVHRTSILTGFFYQIKSQCLRLTDDEETLASYVEAEILEHQEEWTYFDDYIMYFGLSQTSRVQKFFDDLSEKQVSSPVSRSVLIAPLVLYKQLATNSKELFDPTPYLTKYLLHYGNSPAFFTDLECFFSSITTKEVKEQIAQTIGTELEKQRLNFSTPEEIQSELNYSYALRYFEDAECNNVLLTVEGYVKKYLQARGKQLADGVEWPLNEGPHDFFTNLVALTLSDQFWPSSSEWTWSSVNGEEDVVEASCSNDTLQPQLQATTNILITVEESGVKSRATGSNGVNETGFIAFNNDISFQELENQKPFLPNKRDVAPLVALSILHYCLDKSPKNSQTRLLLAKTYIRCGAVGAGAHVLAELDIKHFMLLSMSYLSTWKLLSCAHFEDGARSLSMLESFYSNFEKEGMEHVLSAYKYGSWEKIIEFLEFRDHVLNSFPVALMKVEKGLLEYLTDGSTTILSETQNQLILVARRLEFDVESNCVNLITQLSDNRDLEIIDTFKICGKMKDWMVVSFAADKQTFKVRSIILGLINNFILLAEDWSSPPAVLERLSKTDHLLTLFDEVLRTDSSKFLLTDITVGGMWPPRVSQYIAGGCLSYLFTIFKLNADLVREQNSIDFSPVIVKLNEYVDGVLKDEKIQKLTTEVCLLEIGNILETFTELVETLSLSCIILDVSCFVVNRFPGAQTKTKKKKHKPVEKVPIHVSQLVNLISTTVDSLKTVDAFLRIFTGVVSNNYPSSWETMAEFWISKVNTSLLEEILPYSLPIVVAKLRSSYINSATLLSILISKKLKYLKLMLQELGCSIKEMDI